MSNFVHYKTAFHFFHSSSRQAYYRHKNSYDKRKKGAPHANKNITACH